MVRKLSSGVILHAGNFVPPPATSDAQTAAASAPVAAFQESEPVVLRVDNAVRDYHSRLHTAGHIVSLAVRQLADVVGVVSEGKANHAPGSSWVEFGGLIGSEHKIAIEAEANRMVALNRPVLVRWWDLQQVKERCAAVPDGMTAPPPGENLLRVVDIEGLGAYPCGGTHLPTTANIGKVIIRKISRQKGMTKISYEVSPGRSE
jgi:Ser-tRNA(Ala) deacylase AlaX